MAHDSTNSDAIRLFALALLLRLAFAAAVAVWGHAGGELSPDSDSYLVPARELLERGTFTRDGVPETNRAPGYPVLLAVGQALGGTVVVTRTIQVLLSAVTVVLVHRLALLLSASRAAALLAGLFAACEPSGIVYPMKILSESSFTFVLVAGVLAALHGLSRRSLRHVALGAILLGLSIYIRPIAKLMPLVIISPMVVWPGLKGWSGSARFRGTCLAMLLVLPFVMMIPWQLRNDRAAGYHGFVSQHDRDLFIWQGAAVLNRVAAERGDPVRLTLGDEAPFFKSFPNARHLPRAAQLERMGRAGRDILLREPATFLAIFAQGVLENLFAPGAGIVLELLDQPLALSQSAPAKPMLSSWRAHLQRNPGAIAPMGMLLVFNGALFMLGVLPFLRSPWLRSPFVWVVALTVLYFPLVSGGPWGTSRLRVPSMPFLAVLAGQGAMLVLEALRRKGLGKGARHADPS